jgi:hypothetical protein
MDKTIESLLTMGIVAGGGYLLYANVPIIKDFVDHLFMTKYPDPVNRDLKSSCTGVDCALYDLEDNSDEAAGKIVQQAQKDGLSIAGTGGILNNANVTKTAQDVYALYAQRAFGDLMTGTIFRGGGGGNTTNTQQYRQM